MSGEEKATCTEVWLESEGGDNVIVVSGATRSSVQVRSRGAERLRYLSRAATRNRCEPSVETATGWGLVHGAKVSVFEEHSKVQPASFASKAKETLVAEVYAGGPLVIWTVGAVVSTVNVMDTGIDSSLPARSVALTEKTCSPSLKAFSERGDRHGANAAPSKEQA